LPPENSLKPPHLYLQQNFATEPLRQRGVRVGQERVRKMMRDNAIRARSKRKYQATTDSHHGWPVLDNVLNRDF
jgi:transposase InsO family protein